MASGQTLYVFIDESGDFNFSPKGTNFYTFTAIMANAPCEGVEAITKLRLELLSGEKLPRLGTEYLENYLCKLFHATEDKQPVRDLFFDLVRQMDCFSVNSIVIRKNRTNKVLREPVVFYPKFLGSLLDYVFQVYSYSQLCIFVDGTPVNNQKLIFIQTIKREITKRNPKTLFRVYFPTSASNCYLQITDYINWAIFKKWETDDLRSYDLIKHLLQAPERDIFVRGNTDYY